MNGWELDELHDVAIANPQNNDFLRYNSTFGTWKNHALTKTDVGLGNVDNTSDANKPISTATQTALNAKENTITSGTTGQYYRGDKTFQTLNGSAVSNDSNVSGTSVKEALNIIKTVLDTTNVVAINGSNITTTSGTAVDITGLVTPTLPPSSTWYFEIYLSVTCGGAGGLRFGFTSPVGSNGALFIEGTATTAATYQQTSTTGALAGTAINRAATSSLGKLYGRVIIGANAGVVQLQFASGTGGQLSTIVGTGISIMRITRVA
jgi:hypothetical protein